jgi:hypothetical protein
MLYIYLDLKNALLTNNYLNILSNYDLFLKKYVTV